MVADRWLAQVELLGNLADTQRAALLDQQIKHAQSCLVGQRLEALGQRDHPRFFRRLRKRIGSTARAIWVSGCVWLMGYDVTSDRCIHNASVTRVEPRLSTNRKLS